MESRTSESPATNTPKLRPLIKALTIDFSPLRASRDFRLIYIGQFVSAFGSAVSYVVLP